MNVSELIERLQKCNEHADVRTEGCDCFGDIGSVDGEGETVFLMRTVDKSR